MSEMVERVARAIANLHFEGCEVTADGGSVAACVGRCQCREAARAAILAMREPTQALIEAGACVRTGEGDDTTGRDLAADIYRAMIDAAVTP